MLLNGKKSLVNNKRPVSILKKKKKKRKERKERKREVSE